MQLDRGESPVFPRCATFIPTRTSSATASRTARAGFFCTGREHARACSSPASRERPCCRSRSTRCRASQATRCTTSSSSAASNGTDPVVYCGRRTSRCRARPTTATTCSRSAMRTGHRVCDRSSRARRPFRFPRPQRGAEREEGHAHAAAGREDHSGCEASGFSAPTTNGEAVFRPRRLQCRTLGDARSALSHPRELVPCARRVEIRLRPFVVGAEKPLA